jgi:hypothetical protein
MPFGDDGSAASALEEQESKELSANDVSDSTAQPLQITYVPKSKIPVPNEVILASLRHHNPKVIDLLLDIDLNEFEHQAKRLTLVAASKVLARLEDLVIMAIHQAMLKELGDKERIENLNSLFVAQEFKEEVADIAKEHSEGYMAQIFGCAVASGLTWSYNHEHYQAENKDDATWVRKVASESKDDQPYSAVTYQKMLEEKISLFLTTKAQIIRQKFIQKCQSHFQASPISVAELKEYIAKEEKRVSEAHTAIAEQYLTVQNKGHHLVSERVNKRNAFLASFDLEEEIPQELASFIRSNEPLGIGCLLFSSCINDDKVIDYLFHAVRYSPSIDIIDRLLGECDRLGHNPLKIINAQGNNLFHLIAERASSGDKTVEPYLILEKLIAASKQIGKKNLYDQPPAQKMSLCYEVLRECGLNAEIEQAMQALNCSFPYDGAAANSNSASQQMILRFGGYMNSRSAIREEPADVIKEFFEQMDVRLAKKGVVGISLVALYDQKIMKKACGEMLNCLRKPNQDGQAAIKLFFDLDRAIYYIHLASLISPSMLSAMTLRNNAHTGLVRHIIDYEKTLNDMITGEKNHWFLSYALRGNLTTPKKELEHDLKKLLTHFDEPGKTPANNHDTRVLMRWKHVSKCKLELVFQLTSNQNLTRFMESIVDEGDQFLAWYSAISFFYTPIKEMLLEQLVMQSNRVALLEQENRELRGTVTRQTQIITQQAQTIVEIELERSQTVTRLTELELRQQTQQQHQQDVTNAMMRMIQELQAKVGGLTQEQDRSPLAPSPTSTTPAFYGL